MTVDRRVRKPIITNDENNTVFGRPGLVLGPGLIAVVGWMSIAGGDAGGGPAGEAAHLRSRTTGIAIERRFAASASFGYRLKL